MAGAIPTRGPLGFKPEKGPKPRRKRLANKSKKPRQGADSVHLSFVRSLPCCICWEWNMPQLSPTAAHHCIHGRYSSRRVPDAMTIPLCHDHHTGLFDHSKVAIHREPARWRELYGEDVQWLSWVEERLLNARY